MTDFSHYTKEGRSVMVDITGKDTTYRVARAYCFVRMKQDTLEMIIGKLLPKGDPFEVARIAGIMAAKKTSELIPMCHPLLISHVDVNLKIDADNSGVIIESEVSLEGKTGVEMEALTAVTTAALTLYDMCKAVDKEIVISEIRLIEKKGGKSDQNYDKKQV